MKTAARLTSMKRSDIKRSASFLLSISICLFLYVTSFNLYSGSQDTDDSVLNNTFGTDVPVFTYQKTLKGGALESESILGFTDVTALYGISSLHSYRSKNISSIQEAISAAVCVFDFNNDNFEDIFSIGGGGFQREFGRAAWWSVNAQNKLYMNNAGNGFDEVEATLFSELAGKSLNCAAADLDNDGDIDLLVTTTEGHFLFENRRFNKSGLTEKTVGGEDTTTAIASTFFYLPIKIPGVDATDFPMHALLTDLDGDGNVDIYSSHFIKYQRGRKTAQTSQGFESLTATEFRAELFDSLQNKLLFNKGSLEFEETQALKALTSGVGRSIAAQTVNINHDQFPDLLVVNSYDSRSRLFVGSSKGYQEATDELLQFSIDSMQGFAQSSFLTADLNAEDSRREFSYIVRPSGKKNILKQRSQNTLMHWDAISASETDKSSSLYRSDWSPIVRDFDLNGYQDIFVASGMTKTTLDSKNVMLGQSNYMYWRGINPYSSPAEDTHLVSQSSRGAAVIDIDNDGISEIVVANNNGSTRLLKITGVTGKSWIGLSLPAHSSWLHAKIKLKGRLIGSEKHKGERNEVTYQYLHPQSTFSQHDPRLVIAVESKPPYQLIIEKQDGKLFEYQLESKNSYYVVSHSGEINTVGIMSDDATNATNATAISGKQPLNRLQIQANLVPNYISKDIDAFTQKALIARLSVDFHSLKKVIHQYWNELHPQTQFWLWDTLIFDPKNNPLKSLLSDQNKKQQLIEILSLEAIRSNQIDLIYEAIDYQLVSENEEGLDWLLLLLNASNEELVCYVAKVFQHYFVEEEAVLIRKQTAVPLLINVLEHKEINSNLANCVLNAIGESENQRASIQLLTMLNGDPALLAPVVRTLGRLRDSRATKAIEKMLVQESDPSLLAEVLVAMERMVDSKTRARLFQLSRRLSTQAYWQTLAAITKSEDVVTFSSDIVNDIDAQLFNFNRENTAATLQNLNSETAIAQITVASHRGLQPRHLQHFTKHPSNTVRFAFLLFAMQQDLSSKALSTNVQNQLLLELDSDFVDMLAELTQSVISERPFQTSDFAQRLFESIVTTTFPDLTSAGQTAKYINLLQHVSPQNKSALLLRLSTMKTSPTDSVNLVTLFLNSLRVSDFDWSILLAKSVTQEQGLVVLYHWYSTLNSTSYDDQAASVRNRIPLNINSKIQLLLNKTLIDVAEHKSKNLMLLQEAAISEPEIVLGSLLEMQKRLSIVDIVGVIGQFPGDFLSSNKQLQLLIVSLTERAINADKTELIEQLSVLSKNISLRARNTKNRTVIYVQK
jgi:hypothetical protein